MHAVIKNNLIHCVWICVFFIITSPTGAVAKYSDEYVCLWVCMWVCGSVWLSMRISPEPHVQSLPNFLCMLPVSVARSSDMFTIGCVAYDREAVFFPIDNAYISGTTRAIFAKFLSMLPVSVARSPSDTFTIGRIAGKGFFPHWKCIIGWERGMGVHSAGEVCCLRLPCFSVVLCIN